MPGQSDQKKAQVAYMSAMQFTTRPYFPSDYVQTEITTLTCVPCLKCEDLPSVRMAEARDAAF